LFFTCSNTSQAYHDHRTGARPHWPSCCSQPP
jgi:hypothetical protein